MELTHELDCDFFDCPIPELISKLQVLTRLEVNPDKLRVNVEPAFNRYGEYDGYSRVFIKYTAETVESLANSGA